MKNDPDYQPRDPTTSPRFADISTFFRLPRMPLDARLDVALVGVPFDMGVNFRASARHGPAAVREASRIIRRLHPTSGIAPFALCNVADIGDAPVNPLNPSGSIDLIEQYFHHIVAIGATRIAIGGDHTIPLPIVATRRTGYVSITPGQARGRGRHMRSGADV
jgi:guanidinopropionase